MSKREKARIRHEASQPMNYCWVTSCWRLEPCSRHYAINNPRVLDSQVAQIEASFRESRREHLGPCLIPLYQALKGEYDAAILVEIRETGNICEQTRREVLRIKARLEELEQQGAPPPRQQTCPRAVPMLTYVEPIPQSLPTLGINFRHDFAVAGKRLASQYGSIQRLSNKTGLLANKHAHLEDKCAELVEKEAIKKAIHTLRQTDLIGQIISDFAGDGKNWKITTLASRKAEQFLKQQRQKDKRRLIRFLFE